MVGFLTASADKASAMVYCLAMGGIAYRLITPANCMVRPGVVLRSSQ